MAAVLEKHLNGIGDRALVRVQVFAGVTLVFHDFHFFAQGVDQRVGGVEWVFIVLCRQVAKDQRYRSHVLNAVIAVRRVGQGALLGNDADGGFMGGDDDTLDFVEPVFHLRVQGHRSFTGGLGMELRREADLEQNVFHHIGAVVPLEAELALTFRFQGQVFVGVAEGHIVEAPLWGGEHAGNAHFAAQGHIGQAHGAGGGVPGGPGFA